MAQCQQATPQCHGHKVVNSHTHTHRVTEVRVQRASTCVRRHGTEGEGAKCVAVTCEEV